MAGSRATGESLALTCADAPTIRIAGAFGLEPVDVAAVAHLSPQVVAIDVCDLRALRLVPTIVEHTSARILLFGIPEASEVVIDCACTGASGLLGSEASLADLANAVVSVALGEDVCASRIARTLVRHMASLASSINKPALTYREREIAELVASGMSNKEIARSLCISVPTVKIHVSKAMRKLGVSRRYEIAAALVSSRHPKDYDRDLVPAVPRSRLISSTESTS